MSESPKQAFNASPLARLRFLLGNMMSSPARTFFSKWSPNLKTRTRSISPGSALSTTTRSQGIKCGRVEGRTTEEEDSSWFDELATGDDPADAPTLRKLIENRRAINQHAVLRTAVSPVRDEYSQIGKIEGSTIQTISESARAGLSLTVASPPTPTTLLK